MVWPPSMVVTPDVIAEDGGWALSIRGTFLLQHAYRVYIGGTGSAADPGCPSGKAGQGYIIYPWTADTIRCYSPVLAPGGIYILTVIDQDTGAVDQQIDAVAVVRRQFYSKVYATRRLFAPWPKTGPRSIDREAL